MLDLKACLELVVALGAIAALWLRLEHRLTRVEDRVQERYRDKKALNDRVERVEKWLPKGAKEE